MAIINRYTTFWRPSEIRALSIYELQRRNQGRMTYKAYLLV